MWTRERERERERKREEGEPFGIRKAGFEEGDIV